MKNSTFFVCSECGEEFAKWSGNCLNCGKWNTLKEFKVESLGMKDKTKSKESARIYKLNDVKVKNINRIKVGIGEFDRVLGGGFVPGSVVLIGGDPGIGKSTITAQVVERIENSLYVSGEESVEQIKLRIDRIGVDSKKVNVITETNIDSVIKSIAKNKPKIVIIDSIQTMYSDDFPSTPGSLVQVRECALKLQTMAKKLGITTVIVGHVTKQGNVAGPKILEHLVDAVLYLEGEKYHNNRILRATKNRFGSVDEIGIFEMTEKGMREVDNPSAIFLTGSDKSIAGSVVAVSIEGNRPILIEIQALVTKSVFGYPKRTCSGIDLNRLNLLIAVLTKRAKVSLGNYDVYVNIVGGLKTKDPGVDLAICMAVASAFYNRSIDNENCFFGEVGLLGEIRDVKFSQKRKKEAERIGYKKINNNGYISFLVRDVLGKK